FPLLTIMADVLGVLGGMGIMYVERGSDMFAYWNTTTYWVVPRDFLMGVGKSLFFGAIVTLIGCYNGLSTTGGTEGLGRATTATVVHCTMGVIISDFFLTKLMLMLFWGVAWECANRPRRRTGPSARPSSRPSICASASTATRS